MSWGVLPWVYPVWESLGFLDLGDYSLPHFSEVFNYYLLKYFLKKQWQQWQTLFFWAPKSLQMVTTAMNLKETYSLEEKL